MAAKIKIDFEKDPRSDMGQEMMDGLKGFAEGNEDEPYEDDAIGVESEPPPPAKSRHWRT